MPKFKPGDVVKFVAGGPLLAVHCYQDEEGKPVVVASWFTAAEEHKISRFIDETLRLAEESPPGTGPRGARHPS